MDAVRGKMREIWGSAIYRSALLLFFLVVAFSEFPDQRLVVGLGTLVILHAIASIGLVIENTFLIANHADDLAERKTRHAIILAAQMGRDAGGPDFWLVVDRNVEAEIGARGAAAGSGKWGRVVWHVLSRAASDYAVLALAWLLVG